MWMTLDRGKKRVSGGDQPHQPVASAALRVTWRTLFFADVSPRAIARRTMDTPLSNERAREAVGHNDASRRPTFRRGRPMFESFAALFPAEWRAAVLALTAPLRWLAEW